MPDLTVANVRGTLWDGDAELLLPSVPCSCSNGSLPPCRPSRTTGRYSTAAARRRSQLHSKRSCRCRVTQHRLLVGHVDAMYINRVSQPQGLTFAGRVTVESLDLTSDLRWIQTATGRITWPGGKIISEPRSTAPESLICRPWLVTLRCKAEIFY